MKIFILSIVLVANLFFLSDLKAAGWGVKPCPLPVGPNVVVPNPVNFKNNAAQQKAVQLKNYAIKNNNQSVNDVADWNFMLLQYKMFCSVSKNEEIEDAISSSDYRVKFAAILVAGEKNLQISDKLFDLMDDENKVIQQAARKALAIKSYFLLKEIKEFNLTTEQKKKAQSKVVNPNALKIGLDYVDFGPLPHDSKDISNHSSIRWKSWFSLREAELRDLNKKKKEVFSMFEINVD